MKQATLFIMYLVLVLSSRGQSNGEDLMPDTQIPEPVVVPENAEGTGSDIESSVLQLTARVDINSEGVYDLVAAGLLSEEAYRQLVDYRKTAGDMIDLHELQSVPGWEVEQVRKILPFVYLKRSFSLRACIKDNDDDLSNRLVISWRATFPRSKGYYTDTVTRESLFSGGPSGLTMRLDCRSNRNLSMGCLLDKDPGERFWANGKNGGPDFFSGFLQFRDTGLLRILLVGDYTVNLGQGLISWQTLAGHKGSQVMNMKRESDMFKPYRSGVENGFQRGVALSLGKRNWETGFFISAVKEDSRLVTDTASGETTVSYFPVTGLHRSASEMQTKNKEVVYAAGCRLLAKGTNCRFGVSMMTQRFGYPVGKSEEPYDVFDFFGNSTSHYSADFSFSVGGFHFFGETALDDRKNVAVLSGMMVPVTTKTDFCLFQRRIAPGYVSRNADLFSSGSTRGGESGLFLSAVSRPGKKWELSGYLDMFRHIWLSYLKDFPVENLEKFIQMKYKYNKNSYALLRYRSLASGIDITKELPESIRKYYEKTTSISIESASLISRSVTLKTLICIKKYQSGNQNSLSGFLQSSDIDIRPGQTNLKFGLRLLFFDTDNYKTVIYTYENDLKYSFYYPGFYGKGVRVCLHTGVKIKKTVDFSAKISFTHYKDRVIVGSGWDGIPSPSVADCKTQLVINF